MKQYKRVRTNDVAFAFRMGAGFPGDVNRTHPAAIEAALQNATNPSNQFGQILFVDQATNSVRRAIAADASVTAVKPYGISVRPYPLQAATAGPYGAAAIGSATPPASGVIDVLRLGLIMAKLNDVTAVAKKGAAVYVWATATSGIHTQGGIEVVANGANTVLMTPDVIFNGPGDSDGVVEIAIGM